MLRKLGLLLKTNVRKGTVVARWGGEEFLAVFPNMELKVAALIMERFREKVAQTIRVEDQVVTVSAGLAQARWVKGSRLDEIQASLVEEADQNLYAAKRNGRNQVQWQSSESENNISDRATCNRGRAVAINKPAVLDSSRKYHYNTSFLEACDDSRIRAHLREPENLGDANGEIR